MSRRRKKFDRCWGCGAFTAFVCARCEKPVCVILGSITPTAGGCSKLRAAPGQPGTYHLVCTPRCRLRRSPTVLAVVSKGGKAPSKTAPSRYSGPGAFCEHDTDIPCESVGCSTPTAWNGIEESYDITTRDENEVWCPERDTRCDRPLECGARGVCKLDVDKNSGAGR